MEGTEGKPEGLLEPGLFISILKLSGKLPKRAAFLFLPLREIRFFLNAEPGLSHLPGWQAAVHL